MGFGAPGAENPLILDLCMAYSSLGNLTDRIEQNREIPAYWGRNSQGEYSKSPQELMEGGVCAPMGEHKGFGLAMMHELLAGGLSGGEMGPQVQPLGGWKTHSQSILVINLETTDSLRDWETRMGNLRDDMNQALGNRVRMPGDHLYEMADQQADQILLNEKTMKKLQHFSKNHRVKIPDSK
jgi:LDH2 family malate/lactate/ureidoglycolate dehydrogenase